VGSSPIIRRLVILDYALLCKHFKNVFLFQDAAAFSRSSSKICLLNILLNIAEEIFARIVNCLRAIPPFLSRIQYIHPYQC
jgi:hypothetical protein